MLAVPEPPEPAGADVIEQRGWVAIHLYSADSA
jgi:hypothetical protein